MATSGYPVALWETWRCGAEVKTTRKRNNTEGNYQQKGKYYLLSKRWHNKPT